MLVKKIASSLDVITATIGYKKAEVIMTSGNTPMLASESVLESPVYFELPLCVARNAALSLKYITYLEKHNSEIEIFGAFPVEVVSFLRSKGVNVDITPVPMFLNQRKEGRAHAYA